MPRVWSNLKEGFAYSFGFVPIRALLLLVGLVSLVGIPYSVLLPVFATDVLHGGPDTLGFLVAANGLGALVGAFYLAGRRTVRGLGRVISVCVAVFASSLIAFALARSVALSMAMLLVAGFGVMVLWASANTILQTIVDDDKRGRVMSLYSMAFLGCRSAACSPGPSRAGSGRRRRW